MAGEFRTSENLGLTSMHTLFNREHNRIADLLAKINPKWNDDKLFNETRRIIIAIYQHIVFNEWLPIVTGDTSLSPLKNRSYYNGYNSSVINICHLILLYLEIIILFYFNIIIQINPALTSEFATAAFRFGHSLIQNRITRLNQSQCPFKERPLNLSQIIFNSDAAYE